MGKNFGDWLNRKVSRPNASTVRRITAYFEKRGGLRNPLRSVSAEKNLIGLVPKKPITAKNYVCRRDVVCATTRAAAKTGREFVEAMVKVLAFL